MEQQPTIVRGLFGPKPAVWTLFIFLHFIVATLFTGAGIWMYSRITLENSFVVPLVTMVFLVIVWFVLYFFGRLGKDIGKEEMKILQFFMYATLREHEIALL